LGKKYHENPDIRVTPELHTLIVKCAALRQYRTGRPCPISEMAQELIRRGAAALEAEAQKAKAAANPTTSPCGAPAFKCPQCDRGFSSYAALRIHQAKSHKEGRSPTSCPYCEEDFTTEADLACHISQNHRDKIR